MNIKTRAFTADEIQQILHVAPAHWRHVFRLAYVTGLRVGDLIALKAVRPFNKLSIAEQKTGKTKEIIVGPAIRAAYDFFLDQDFRQTVAKYNTSRKGYLLPAGCPSSYRKATVRYAAIAMLELDRVSFHSFRKAAADEINQNLGIFAAQKFLNHSRVSTTMLYLDEQAIECSSILEAAALLKDRD